MLSESWTGAPQGEAEVREQLSDANPASAWYWGDYVLDPARRRLTCKGEPVEIEDRVFDLLALLLQRRERPLDRQEISAAIWGKRPVSDATLRQLVYAARRAVGDDGESQHTISTLYGRGLQWVAPLEMVFETDDGASAKPAMAVAPGVAAAEPASVVRWRWWPAIAVLACVIVAASAWMGVRALRHAVAVAPRHMSRLAIEPFTNATGKSDLDWVRNGLPGLMGSLLGEAGGLDVVDSKQVVRASQFKPTQGRSREQQLRFATGAEVLVSGRLTKLTDKLYELILHVQSVQGNAAEIRVDGEQPGVLAANAVLRIRRQLGLAGRSATSGKLPGDPFLAEAFARGFDLQARGKVADSISYFKLCVAEAPDFLPCRYYLGIGQLGAGDGKAGTQTLEALLPRAKSQDAPRLTARALLMLADNARLTSSTTSALAYLRRALPFAQRSGDMETVAQIQLMTAITAHSAHDMKLSAQAMAAAEALLQRNPDMRHAREMLYQARFSIAGEGSHPEDAIEPARTVLAMTEEDGNESFAVTALGNLAVALRAAHHTGEAITVNARALQRAHADRFAIDETVDSGNLALGLVNAGLPEAAVVFGDRQYKLSKAANDAQTQAIALLINMTADLQVLDGAKALARLKDGDALAWDSLDPEIVLDRWLYEAMAAYLADPGALPALQQRVDAYQAKHGMTAGLLNRVHYIHALAAAANGRKGDADAALKAAALAGHLDDDGDLELRMAPMLIALRDQDATAATLALKGYDPVKTQDAAILRSYAQWMRQTGDTASAQRAEARLAQLQKQGRDSLASAGLDPNHPFGGAAAVAAGNGG